MLAAFLRRGRAVDFDAAAGAGAAAAAAAPPAPPAPLAPPNDVVAADADAVRLRGAVVVSDDDDDDDDNVVVDVVAGFSHSATLPASWSSNSSVDALGGGMAM